MTGLDDLPLPYEGSHTLWISSYGSYDMADGLPLSYGSSDMMVFPYPMNPMMVFPYPMDPMMVFPYPMAIFLTSGLLSCVSSCCPLLLLFCPTLLTFALAHLFLSSRYDELVPILCICMSGPQYSLLYIQHQCMFSADPTVSHLGYYIPSPIPSFSPIPKLYPYP